MKQGKEKILDTKSARIATLRRRMPFRPFALRLTNGETYVFNSPESFGSTGDLRLIVHFEKHECSSLDADSVTEIIEDTTPKSGNGEECRHNPAQ